MLLPGTQIDRYELVCPIGEGGMAQVWVARQHGKHGFAKLFALKAIHHRFADDPKFRAMFLDEARIAAAIEHPNVAQVFDLGEAASTLYLVMEYVDGESLAAILTGYAKRTGNTMLVPTPIAVRIIADACAGLNAAHKLTDEKGFLRGVVHRDVSPHNLLLSTKGDVKVIDFGIALAKDRVTSDTAEGSLKGKLHYMAPEQARHEKVGPFTDVFSAGATLYRLLAGRPAYQGENEAGTLSLLISGVAAPPLPETAPPLVSAIVERALSPDPDDRYASAAEMQTALEAAIMDEGWVVDVGTWVKTNASERYAERREQLAKATSVTAPMGSVPGPPSNQPAPAVPDLELPGARPAPPAAPPAPPPLPPARPDAPPIDLASELPGRGPGIMSFSAGLTEPKPGETNDKPHDPGFMDIRALAAKKNVSPAALAPTIAEPAAVQAPAGGTGDEPRLELDVERPRTERPRAQPRVSRTGAWIKLAVAIVVIVLLVSGGLLLLPMIVRDRIVSNARELGVELTIDKLGLGMSNVTLRGVTARAPSLPGVTITIDEVYTTTSAQTVRVSGAKVDLDGNARELATNMFKFYEDRRGRIGGTPAEPRHVSLVGARVAWNKPVGEGTRIDASDVSIELDSKGSDDLRIGAGRFEVKTKRTIFGPWTANFEQTAASSRVRLLLDPALVDGPSILYVWGKEVSTKLTIRIPREPITNLGIRPGDLGLPADPSTEIEAKIEGGLAPSTRIEATGKLDLYGTRIKGWKQPVDIRIEGGASAAPGDRKPLELEKVTAQIGPFHALVNGTLTPREDAFRIDATWRTTPIPCDKLVKSEVKNLGTFAETLHDLVARTGAVKVTGSAVGSGLLKYDSATPDDATFTITARESCGLSLFGM